MSIPKQVICKNSTYKEVWTKDKIYDVLPEQDNYPTYLNLKDDRGETHAVFQWQFKHYPHHNSFEPIEENYQIF